MHYPRVHKPKHLQMSMLALAKEARALQEARLDDARGQLGGVSVPRRAVWQAAEVHVTTLQILASSFDKRIWSSEDFVDSSPFLFVALSQRNPTHGPCRACRPALQIAPPLAAPYERKVPRRMGVEKRTGGGRTRKARTLFIQEATLQYEPCSTIVRRSRHRDRHVKLCVVEGLRGPHSG